MKRVVANVSRRAGPVPAGVALGDRRRSPLRSGAGAGKGRAPRAGDALGPVAETGFFRYEHHHRVLAEIVLPTAARAAAREARAIRILSVGCATGEEPYSIAMTVRQNRPSLEGAPVEILAVDPSEDALAVAEKGIYQAARLAGVPAAYAGRYFVPGGDGCTIVPALRQMVKFLRYDIRHGGHLGKFDAVFCCNFRRYVGSDMRGEIVRQLARFIRRDGYLFLGHADGADVLHSSGLPAIGQRRQ
jgi:chemotaxis protein methyltransferase CheR